MLKYNNFNKSNTNSNKSNNRLRASIYTQDDDDDLIDLELNTQPNPKKRQLNTESGVASQPVLRQRTNLIDSAPRQEPNKPSRNSRSNMQFENSCDSELYSSYTSSESRHSTPASNENRQNIQVSQFYIFYNHNFY